MSPTNTRSDKTRNTDIAIVGLALRVPGARTQDAFWQNLREGISAIAPLDREALLAAGETPERLADPRYVPHAAVLDGYDRFDPAFFGFGPKEAAILDPQHRQFLEASWEALESAGHVPETFPGRIGVYAGCGMGSYFYWNVCSHPDLVERTGLFLLRHTGNDKDFLATRVSHVLDLKGPSLSIQTACSTSLVATHQACNALRAGECDLALAGGVTIELPHGRGYLYQEGEVLSPDGHCRAFDHRAAGTVFGSGAAVLALRRLDDALADGDHVFAVIRASAVNNDGAAKAGYLAPSVEGQAENIRAALAAAGLPPEAIGYVECHGTGTRLGDPIEVAALAAAFADDEGRRAEPCRIGSVKTNIGHLDTAAGAAGLIKVALALHHRTIPASLGFEAPNPALELGTRFEVASRTQAWESAGEPRRAGVNALGVGGTNAFAILEEAPPRPASEPSDWPFQLLVVSGRTRTALDANARALAAHLRAHPEAPLADVAFTLKEGRRAFDKRRVLVAGSHEEAASLLEAGDPRRVFTHDRVAKDPPVVFLFPGGGAQYPGMAQGLYETEPVFKDVLDRGLTTLETLVSHDPRALLFPPPDARTQMAERLRRPSLQLPLILIVEVALAHLWMSWGVRPSALVGHSMGENAAACVAGVMSFEDCIRLVHARGRLFDSVAPGGMLSVPMEAAALEAILAGPLAAEGLDIASVNAPQACVASGPRAGIERLAAHLAHDEIDSQRIGIDIAAHSRMLDPILAEFRAVVAGIRLSPPQIPIVSNRTGAVLSAQEATDPDYWVSHLRGTVRFADGIAGLEAQGEHVYLEVGPGRALASLAQANGVPGNRALASLRHPDDPIADDVHFLATVGRLWATGVAVDWEQIWGGARRNRVPLPTYAFDDERFFLERVAPVAAAPGLARRKAAIEEFGYAPVWRPRLPAGAIDLERDLPKAAPGTFLFFMDEEGIAARVAKRLRGAGHRVVAVEAGDGFARLGPDRYTIAPEHGREGYDALLAALAQEEGGVPTRIAHFWLSPRAPRFRPGSSPFHRDQEQGFYSLLHLAQALGDETRAPPPHILVVTSGCASVRGEKPTHPERATVTGPVKVIPRELPGASVALLDIVPPPAPRGLAALAGRAAREAQAERLADAILEELLAAPASGIAALRGGRRFALAHEPVTLAAPAAPAIREGAVCLITGGLGGIGLAVAEKLARESRARLVLLARTKLPPREAWDAHCATCGESDPTSRRIRAVEALEAAGAQVMVVAADVCDETGMREALDRATARFGAIDVVVHAAGCLRDGLIATKRLSDIEDVLTPKVHGTRVLDALFPDGSLEAMVLFSSASVVAAPAGQVDYVAANAFLEAFAHSRAGGRTRVVAIAWGIWNEVGMAAAALAGESGEARADPIAAPLLDVVRIEADGSRCYAARWDARERWVLDGHRTATGEALLPGTGAIEIAAEALAQERVAAPFTIADLAFLRPLEVRDEEPRAIEVHLSRGRGGFTFELRAGLRVDGREAFATTARARIAPGAGAPPPPLDLAAIAARCPRRMRAAPGETLRAPQEVNLRFGPRWRVLRATALGDGEGLAELALALDARGDLEAGLVLHPALLDIATGWAMELVAGYDPSRLWAPVSYETIRVHAPLEAEIVSVVRHTDVDTARAGLARFDVDLCAPDGRVLVAIEGFCVKRLDAPFALSRLPAPRADEVSFVVDAEQAQMASQAASPGRARLARSLAEGIRPDEGAEAFGRAIAFGLPQVVVSSLDLDALVHEAEAETAAVEKPEGDGFARPDLPNAYVEPSTEIERTLVDFWEELLGVSPVGVEDGFFDLGGHSLVAVRLFVKIKKAFGLELPISVLFEAPTIAACAALIEARVGTPSAQTQAASGAQPRLRYVVPMHEGDGGPGNPVFVVAGMFGNVLNLRGLATRLGRGRPVYGLQARGLYGEAPPHASIAEAAAEYLAEIRTVQPRGPYVIGGFSGGGITAFEIARQIEAAGERVALLFMLDTPLPVRPRLTLPDRLLIRLAELREEGPAFLARWARWRIAWEIDRARARVRPEETPEHAFRSAAVAQAFCAAAAVYAPEPWRGPALLLRPPLDLRFRVTGGRFVGTQREYVHADNDWTKFAPALVVETVAGDHDSMVLEPNVRILAARLEHHLACIEAGLGEPAHALALAAE